MSSSDSSENWLIAQDRMFLSADTSGIGRHISGPFSDIGDDEILPGPMEFKVCWLKESTRPPLPPQSSNSQPLFLDPFSRESFAVMSTSPKSVVLLSKKNSAIRIQRDLKRMSMAKGPPHQQRAFPTLTRHRLYRSLFPSRLSLSPYPSRLSLPQLPSRPSPHLLSLSPLSQPPNASPLSLVIYTMPGNWTPRSQLSPEQRTAANRAKRERKAHFDEKWNPQWHEPVSDVQESNKRQNTMSSSRRFVEIADFITIPTSDLLRLLHPGKSSLWPE
ncbi:hypothetical protein JMJ35_009398 [Cladonia borealis]|uniref:Uncharacterized protein n=1 Tax=Cladonia borealis TaxID=184061 RepID=A0AA39QTY4_9LECA|nr:hypothetical protein JMJ35_009398 [Cladonia borealis]